MDSFRAYYEYPSSQAAIQAIPSRSAILNNNNVSPVKSKRSWTNILRIRSKKEKESNTSIISATYSPGFNFSQNAAYGTPSYSVPQVNQYVTSTPYGEINRRNNYQSPSADYGGGHQKFMNYNATYSRGSVNPIIVSATPTSRGTVKNTIKYTDWFGSVVTKKPRLRPSLPIFQSAAILPGENNLPAVTSWDNYIRAAPVASVEIPFSVQNYGNFCVCPDQLFATKGKKKKKCKHCGRRFIGTISKNATALSSVTRVRPALPVNFYQSPTSSWAWTPPTKNQYNQYYVPPVDHQRVTELAPLRFIESPPRTPETIRSSSSSSNTLIPDNSSLNKVIPPPPSVPLPSIPKSNKHGMPIDDKRLSILGKGSTTAYELIENDRAFSSDTDDLSDNAVDDSWDKFDRLRSNSHKQNKSHRVNIVSVGGNEERNLHKVFISTDDHHLASDALKENNNKPSPKKSYSESNSNFKGHSSTSPYANNKVSSFQYDWEKSCSSPYKIDSSSSSSHVNKRSKNKKNAIGMPERDSSKVVNIAGQRILFDQIISVKSADKKRNLNCNKENLPEIGDWEPLHDDELAKEIPDLISFSEKEHSSYETKEPEKIVNKPAPYSNNLRNPEKRWNDLSSDIIHEEEEDEDDEKELDQEKGIEEVEDEDAMIIDEHESSSSDIKLNGNSELDNEDKDTISSSSLESPIRSEGFQPTLSELLQVKSILKRPNSLDTSSETDSDFYLPTFSEHKKNVRKKKSVQFRQSTDVTLVEGETKGRKVNTLRNLKKEKKKIETSVDIAERERREKYNTNWGLIEDLKIESSNEIQDNGQSQLELEKESDELFQAIQKHFPDSKKNDNPLPAENEAKIDNQTLPEKSEPEVSNEKYTTGESIIKLRRSHSQRESVEVNDAPTFNDTFRLRQPINRPVIPSFDDRRRPIRKAPPPPKNPLRPSIPPPPPPTIIKDDDTNSTGSSPPPPLPISLPPPLPTSSPPPLFELDETLENQGITFGSFKDPHSEVSISSRTVQIRPVTDLHRISGILPSSELGGSVFDLREQAPTATVRSRMKVVSVPNLLTFQSANEMESSNVYSSQHSPKAPKRNANRRNKSPIHRSSFLISMVNEKDAEEVYSDHIYEELPSLPSSPSGSNTNTPSPERSMFDGASKYEILEYLQDARHRVNIESEESDDMGDINALSNVIDTMRLEDEEDRYDQDGVSPSRYMEGRSSNRSSNSESSDSSGLLRSDKERLMSGEIERTDSGVGSETSKPNVTIRRSGNVNISSTGLKEVNLPPCDDCETPVEAKVTDSGLMYAPLVCRRCSRRRMERKEILTEIMKTEIKYGKDLRVMMDQFYRPMRVAGLLSKNHIDRIFLNIEDLVEHNRHFNLQIRDAYEIALDQGDEDLLTVNVAKLFLQATPMLHAFQMYCVRQGAASILLQSLEKDRELLRIFLKVSQMENTLLRRMNLHSFLMVPIQRVTKYPLLLARLYNTTPPSHPSREDCRRAKEKIELYLQHINNETKEASPTKLWRRISMSVGNNSGLLKWSSTPPDYDTSIKLRAVTLEILNWNAEEAFIVREGRLQCLPPESTNWTRRGRNLKLASVHMVLVTLGRPTTTIEEATPEDGIIISKNLGIKEVAILAFKDHRLTKTALIREPWLMSRSVLTWDAEGESECFEITDLTSKETFIFKDRECVSTEEWFRSIQFHTLAVGSWRNRRKALAHIMINGSRRS